MTEDRNDLKGKVAIWVTIGAAFGVQILTWFVLYPLAGYNDLTLNLALAVTFLLGVGLIYAYRLGWKRVGLGLRRLLTALLAIAASYALVLVVLLILNALGGSTSIFRGSYTLYAFASNWILTALGEELLFAGALFTLVAARLPRSKRWLVVLLVATVFALWHLPGYVAIALRSGGLRPDIVFDLLLRLVSWGFFGTIYALSGNLWLTAFVHASTDYALLPVVVNSPLVGLAFMLLNVGIAWWLGRCRVARES
ncbi:MAG: CPBP family glutamic-type intramembrane protease [Anaerolineae bacterium]